jgi:hypothetical protein
MAPMVAPSCSTLTPFRAVMVAIGLFLSYGRLIRTTASGL